jgi:hypothetical protein
MFLGGKVKVKLSLVYLLKDVWKSGGAAPCIINLGTGWRRVVSFTPRLLYPQERAPDTHLIGSLVDAVAKRRSPSIAPARN